MKTLELSPKQRKMIKSKPNYFKNKQKKENRKKKVSTESNKIRNAEIYTDN